jgi:hypothetical protein
LSQRRFSWVCRIRKRKRRVIPDRDAHPGPSKPFKTGGTGQLAGTAIAPATMAKICVLLNDSLRLTSLQRKLAGA